MFTHTRLSKLAATVIGGAAIGLAALASAGNATASSTDDALLNVERVPPDGGPTGPLESLAANRFR
jgi:hypothetical protein